MTQEPREPDAQTPAEPGATPPPADTGTAPPPQQSWQSQPQQPGAPPPGGGAPPSGTPAWVGSLTDQTPVPGPAGYFYADVPNRTIAFVIDFIIIFVGLIVLAIVIGAIFPAVTLTGPFLFEPNPAFALVYGLLALLFSAGYFVYTWVAMRGTPGMKVLGMQVGHETDGRTLTYQEAIVRYALLFGPFIVADILGRFAAGLGTVLWLLGIVWFIVLLVTTAQSLTKQGLHDRYARSMVVKAGRAVG